MAEEKPKEKKTVVRGPDGALHVVSKTGTVKLTDSEAQEVTEAIEKTKEKLEAIVAEEMSKVAAGCHQNVHIAIPDMPA
jgi:hypothetical protein